MKTIETSLAGIRLKNPFLLASGPSAATGAMIARAFEAGWGGAVTKTIHSDSLAVDDVSPRFGAVRDEQGAVLAFENIEQISKRSVTQWVSDIRLLKREWPGHAVIASVMAPVTPTDWQDLAQTLEDAGADALELNLSCPNGLPEKGLGQALGQDADLAATLTGWVKQKVRIPVMPKLTPNVTSIAAVGRAVQAAGADAVAAINTVSGILGVDLETWTPYPVVAGYSTLGGVSGAAMKPLGLRAVAELSAALNIPVSGMGGIRTASDTVEYLLLGATTVQVCTAVMVHGYGVIDRLTAGLRAYLARKQLGSVRDLVGQSLGRLVAHHELSRAARVRPSFGAACVLCGRCVTACRDAAYQALCLQGGLLSLDLARCDGCSLCEQVCPNRAVHMVERSS